MKALIIPLLVVGTLVSMLVPVPTMMMDFLIGANLIFALALLLSALALTDTLKLTSLPSLLLLATLFRLALNISSTRNILGGGDAGQIIDAFGKVVVNGNLIVGIVIFAIITLVQFIVIAKGSERVAEVAARFTLDALPGKQMSIDADLRSGILDLAQARAKRQDLQTESRFYGALDGAMKFVKGDAIAGIVITLINLVGGIAVGAFVADLGVLAAIQKYSLLTVGDGLTAQIPSLLNSLAAGIVVTRVSKGDDRTLAQDLIQQLSAVRSVKIIIGIFALGLACAPEMPVMPFVTLGLLLLFSAATQKPEAPLEDTKPANWIPRPPALIALEISRQMGGKPTINQEILALNRAAREQAFNSMGLLLPNIECTPADDKNPGATLLIRGVPVAHLAETEELKAVEQLINRVIKQHALELVDDSMTRRLIDSLDAVMSESLNTVIPTVISVTQVTELLKALVSEEISIRSFDLILQAISEHATRSPNARVLLEEVRIALKRSICAHVSGGKPSAMQALRLNPVVDYEISKLEREGQILTLSLMEPVGAFLLEHKDTNLIVVSRGARRLVRQLVELHGLSMTVIAFEELVEGAKLDFVGVFEGDTQHSLVGVDKLAA